MPSFHLLLPSSSEARFDVSIVSSLSVSRAHSRTSRAATRRPPSSTSMSAFAPRTSFETSFARKTLKMRVRRGDLFFLEACRVSRMPPHPNTQASHSQLIDSVAYHALHERSQSTPSHIMLSTSARLSFFYQRRGGSRSSGLSWLFGY